MTEEFLIFAKPKIKTVDSAYFTFYKYAIGIQKNDILLHTKQNFNLQSVFLSSSNTAMFSGVEYYDFYSKNKHLSAYNLPFSGYMNSSFSYTNYNVYFTLDQLPQTEGKFVVIVKNEAGYSISPEISVIIH